MDGVNGIILLVFLRGRMVIVSQIGYLAHAVDDLIRSHLQLWGGQNCYTLADDAINMLANTPWG